MTAWRQVRGRIPGQKHPGDPVAEVSHPVRPVTRDDPHRTDCLSPLTHGRLLFRSVPFVRSFVLSPSSFLFPLEINFSRYSEKPNASTSARTPCVVSFSVVCCRCVCCCCRRRFCLSLHPLSFIVYPRAGTLTRSLSFVRAPGASATWGTDRRAEDEGRGRGQRTTTRARARAEMEAACVCSTPMAPMTRHRAGGIKVAASRSFPVSRPDSWAHGFHIDAWVWGSVRQHRSVQLRTHPSCGSSGP